MSAAPPVTRTPLVAFEIRETVCHAGIIGLRNAFDAEVRRRYAQVREVAATPTFGPIHYAPFA